MPLDLKNRIKALAFAEDRTMAKWCAIKLREIVEAMDPPAGSPEAKPQVVETQRVTEPIGQKNRGAVKSPIRGARSIRK